MNTTLPFEYDTVASLDVIDSECLEVETPQATEPDCPIAGHLGTVIAHTNLEITAGSCPNQQGCAKTGCTGACGRNDAMPLAT
ncbi:MAG: hypothetical protein ACQR33_01525 [Candidatus Saccharibacteria bacterium]